MTAIELSERTIARIEDALQRIRSCKRHDGSVRDIQIEDSCKEIEDAIREGDIVL